MKSSKGVKTSYKRSLIIFPILLIFSAFLILGISSCSRDNGPEKIDIGSSEGLPAHQPPEVQEQTEEPVTEDEDEEQESKDVNAVDDDDAIADDNGQEDAEKPPKEELEEKASEPITVRAYYADSQVQHLVPEERLISDTHKYLSAFMELLKKPLEPGNISLVPENTRVNRISLRDGNIELDLSREFVDERFVSNIVDVLLIYSIVNTLTEFEEVNTVTFYVEGKKLDLIGQLDISRPLHRDESWIKN